MKTRRPSSVVHASIVGLVLRLVTVGVSSTAVRAETLDIMAISAASGPAQTDSALRDLLPLLRRHLPNYTAFKLLDRRAVGLPTEAQRVSLAGRLTVHCQGSSQRLSLTVADRDRVIVHTQVSLRLDVPLVFAGVPNRDGILALAVVVRR
jgi:hypothetical protein